MSKWKSICEIKTGNSIGTGFFCKIPFPNKDNMLKVFITAGYIVNENDEKISIFIKDKKIKELNLNNRIKYTSRSRYNDTTIIEIKDEDKIVNNYLELDYKILLNYTKKNIKVWKHT